MRLRNSYWPYAVVNVEPYLVILQLTYAFKQFWVLLGQFLNCYDIVWFDCVNRNF